MPTPGGVMVWRSVCAPWVSLWVWLLMGVKLLRSGRGCVQLPGLKLARVLRSITSLAPYIYNR